MTVRPAAAALTMAAAVMVAACKQQPARNAAEDAAPVPVVAEPATTGTLRSTLTVNGVVVPMEGAEFLAISPEPARILEVTKQEGDAVAAGEILVRLDLPSATQELARQRAELSRVQAQLENARIAQARVRDYVTRGLVPRNDQDVAGREVADAQAAFERVSVLHAAAEAASERSTIRAPFAGIVARRLRNPGDVVQAAATDPIVRVIDPKRLEVWASIPEADVSRVLPGATARMADPLDAHPVALTVASRPAGPAAPDKTMPARLTIVDATTAAVDTTVNVEIDAGERANVVFVVPEAVVRERDQTAVMLAAGERAERRAVTVGLASGDRVEIVEGLKAGELVITRGQVGLTDGAAISVSR